MTTLPCPSCGSTRSLIALARGDLQESLYLNPIGILLAAMMIAGPFWICIDLIGKRSSLLNFYLRTEEVFRQRKYAVPAIILLTANWIWNFYKGF